MQQNNIVRFVKKISLLSIDSQPPVRLARCCGSNPIRFVERRRPNGAEAAQACLL